MSQTSPLAIVDAGRADLFGRMTEWGRLLADPIHWKDEDGVWWAAVRRGPAWLGWTWLGPGWIFDAFARSHRADEHGRRLEMHLAAGEAEHRLELAGVVNRLRLGEITGRLLWAVHVTALASRSSVLTISFPWLAETVWGPDRATWPRHWLGDIVDRLKEAAELHVAEHDGDGFPPFGEPTALLTHVGRLPRNLETCSEICPGRGRPPHAHLRVTIGQGFMGVLERSAQTHPDSGERTYDLRAKAFREAGKTGRLVSVFLPAELAGPPAAPTFSPAQRGLIRASVRELTRPPRIRRGGRGRHGVTLAATPEESSQAQILPNNKLPDAAGRKPRRCDLLAEDRKYVGFNGNGCRRGLGYMFGSPGGWLTRAGYRRDDYQRFLADLGSVADRLGLVVVGLRRGGGDFFGLDHLTALCGTAAGRDRLADVHLRLFTEADWLERWPAAVGMGVTAVVGQPDGAGITEHLGAMKKSWRQIARDLGVDPSLLSKIRRGKKRWPANLLARVQSLVAEPQPRTCAEAQVEPPVETAGRPVPSAVDAALSYLIRGWSVVPQLPNTKRPTVKWKRFQDQRPCPEEIRKWYATWPDAGVTVVAGPVSGLLVVDVDGQAAHEELLRRLGQEPLAPKVLSGSGEPFRYHLYFAHPYGITTGARKTPWHPKLEFKGHRATLVLPPSLHRSGRRYRWAVGQSLDELPVAELPPEIRQALLEAERPPDHKPIVLPLPVDPSRDMSQTTARFLNGFMANKPQWNINLFLAACDLKGRDWPLEEAEPLLIAGAQPWTTTQADEARATIHSAFSRPRARSRH